MLMILSLSVVYAALSDYGLHRTMAFFPDHGPLPDYGLHRGNGLHRDKAKSSPCK